MINKNTAVFNAEDISQIMIGAFALAVPVAFTEEAWQLGQSLPIVNLLLLFVLSMVFLTFFTYQSVFQQRIKFRLRSFIARVLTAYFLALLVVTILLIALNKLPILSDPATAIRRLVIITMPASMGAIIVDSLDKE